MVCPQKVQYKLRPNLYLGRVGNLGTAWIVNPGTPRELPSFRRLACDTRQGLQAVMAPGQRYNLARVDETPAGLDEPGEKVRAQGGTCVVQPRDA